MFTALLFTKTKAQKQSMFSETNHWFKKLWYIFTMEYYSDIKGNEILPCEATSVQFSSVAQSCPTFCDSMNRSTPGLPVHHQFLEFTQTHVHRVGDAIQPSHPLSPSSPSLFQHQDLYDIQWVSSSHQVAKVLEFQHQSLQWISRLYFL